MGALSSLPLINIGNACCCLWVIGGGVVAAYLLQDQEPGPITAGDGAMVGLFAGLIGAVIALIISIPIRVLMAPIQRQFIDRLLQNGQLPPQVEQYISNSAFSVIGLVISFFFMVFAGAVFSTLGGLLGAAIFRKKTPPGVIDVPPSSYPPPPPPPTA